MKKLLLIGSVLLVAVLSTACINNLAVQELNNKAMEFAQKGDYPQAIERLKSSLDLDSTIVETHYNLAVAYTQVEEYNNAVDEFKKVLELKPDLADTYYSLATAQNNLAVAIEDKQIRLNSDGTFYKPTKEDDLEEKSEKSELTDNEQAYLSELYDSAIENYEKYLELNPDAKEKTQIQEQIGIISEKKVI